MDAASTPTAGLSRTLVALIAIIAFAGGFAFSAVVPDNDTGASFTASAADGPRIREYFLEIRPAEIDMGDGLTWRAWTFNGSVPGPTIYANVGDILRVTVKNTHDVVHSFHTHLAPYGLDSDGSQLNTITGIGAMAMIEPGNSYTYEFTTSEAGLFYYHCHSAAGDKTISQHIAQGLYGAIVIKGPQEVPARDEVMFMAETGFDRDKGAPYYIMNGHGLPGGEHRLMEIFKADGVGAVAAQFGKTIPLLQGKVGEPVRLSVVNIGDQIHSFHLHAMTAYYVDHDKGQPVPAQVLGLVPGEADRILVTPTQAGVWLFHCHVVSHADAGMIGVFVVEP